MLFDLDADGLFKQVAWRPRNTDVSFIARDLHHNGVIDDGSQLFGSATRLTTGQRAANGFLALADLDANGDRRVDAADPAYATIHLWTDWGSSKSIKYEFTLAITLSTAQQSYVLTASHDGFPNYRVVLDNQEIYFYHHGPRTLFSLGHPREI